MKKTNEPVRPANMTVSPTEKGGAESDHNNAILCLQDTIGHMQLLIDAPDGDDTLNRMLITLKALTDNEWTVRSVTLLDESVTILKKLASRHLEGTDGGNLVRHLMSFIDVYLGFDHAKAEELSGLIIPWMNRLRLPYDRLRSHVVVELANHIAESPLERKTEIIGELWRMAREMPDSDPDKHWVVKGVTQGRRTAGMIRKRRSIADQMQPIIETPDTKCQENTSTTGRGHMTGKIEDMYLPFTEAELEQHFTTDIQGQIRYYVNSANRYKEYNNQKKSEGDISIAKVRHHRQIEKDERFWTVTATKRLFDDPLCRDHLKKLLIKAYGVQPPFSGCDTWEQCLEGEMILYFEACLSSSDDYVDWLPDNPLHYHMIPYIREAAERTSKRTLEGATHVDAMFLNVDTGFAWLIEAKVLSDISCSTTFNNMRNQIARSLDVMLDKKLSSDCVLAKRKPEMSLFSLLTPRVFHERPHSRFYGYIYNDYKRDVEALKRDLPHRLEAEMDWQNLQQRIGWITFEDFNEVCPNACPWLQKKQDR